MGRLIEAFAQFFDGNGDPLAYGWLRFLVSSSNNTPKDTYNDPDYQIPNANPLQLDAEGRCPSVFGIGEYRIISYVNDPDEEDSPGEQIQMFDPVSAQGTVEATGTGTVFDAWSASVTYDLGDIVTQNFNYYRSLGNSNLGFDPLLEDSWWEQVDFLSYYNSTITYETGNLVYYGDNLYLGLQDGNITHTPTTSPAWWRAVATGCKSYLTQSGDFTITSSHLNYLIILTASAVADATFDLPAMSSTTDKFCLWIYNASDYVLTLDAVGSATVWLNAGGTMELTKGSLVQIRYNSYLDQWIPMGNNGPILGSQDVGTVTYPVLDLYATDIYTATMTATGSVSLALATIDELHIPSDGPIYFGDADEISMIYDSVGTEFNLSVDAGVDITFVNDSIDYWTIRSTGQITPGASNPLPDIGSASASLNFIYTDNISLPDNGEALFGNDDDLAIYSNNTNTYISSSISMNIGTTTLNGVNITANSLIGISLNSDLSTTFYNDMELLSNSSSFSIGSPTKFSISSASASGPTYINASSIGGLYFRYSTSNVFYYNSLLDFNIVNNVRMTDDKYIIFGNSGDVEIGFNTTENSLYLNTLGAYDILFRTNSSSSSGWVIDGTSGDLYPELFGNCNIGSAANPVGITHSISYYGANNHLYFGRTSSFFVDVTDMYEEEVVVGVWRLVFEFYSATGTGRTYYLYANE